MGEITNFRRLRHAEPDLLPRLQRAAIRRRNRDRWAVAWITAVGFLAAAAIGSLLLGAAPAVVPGFASTATGPEVAASFPLCTGGVRGTCVVDGDTFWLDGLKYRIADIDTPEVSKPSCAAEKALGDRATLRLAELLNAGAFTLEPADRDEDRYGRKLRILNRDGASIGGVLVGEGLAHRWDGRKHSWC